VEPVVTAPGCDAERERTSVTRGLHRRVLHSCSAALFALLLAQASAADPIRLLLVGDSITYGVTSGPAGPGYAEVLVGLLGESYEVVNAALSGTSSIHWDPDRPCGIYCPDAPDPSDSFFDLHLTPELPVEIAAILLGTNDALGFSRPEPSTAAVYEQAMSALIDGLLSGGAETVLLMTPPPLPGDRPVADELLLDYRDVIFALCDAMGGVLCGPDVYTLLDPDTHFEDIDAHPNVAGHQLIAEALYGSIAAIPEPGTGLLVATGLLGLAMRRRWASGAAKSK